MSQSQPPRPPETPAVIRPGADETRADYIEVQVPVASSVTPEPVQEGGGCLWGLGGALGCSVLIFALVAGLLLAAGQTVGGLIGNVSDFFKLPELAIFAEGAGVRIPEDVYIPPVERLQALSQLTTTRFNYSHIVTSEVEMPGILSGLYGQGLAYVAVGHINAGIDVGQLDSEDVIYDAERNLLTVILPAPVLQDCFLDESQSYVVTRSTGIFAQPSIQLESAARRFAIEQYRDMALEDGILEEARDQSVQVMEEFLSSIVGDVVLVIEVAPIDPNAPLPDTCQ
ncbi:MAG: DUF4230 domain-containing protein [Anaerolineae bacterium]|nr:DUF4230 domain-containing protein [Anaerolineae bacterium]